MKRRLGSLKGFTIGGTNGEIGKVRDFYFEDNTWIIRYLIVKTGSWLSGRKVLLSPTGMTGIDWQRKLIMTNLTTDQIKNSPEIDTDKPVSRQHEMDLYRYYPWGGYYWGGGIGISGMAMSYPVGLNNAIEEEKDTAVADSSHSDPHLRSTDTVTGYNIKAVDGEIGEVEDFIINDSNWQIDFILVDTGNWLPGKKVLIAPKMIREINWAASRVILYATEDKVKNSPVYQPGEEFSESYHANLQNYYSSYI